MRSRVRPFLSAGAVLAITVSCGPKRISPVVQPQTLVVTLADDAGTTGRVTVSNAAGAVELSNELHATRVSGTSAPTPPETMDLATVQEMFGDTLNDVPPPAERFNLYFQSDSDQLIEPSRALIPDVVRAVSARPVPEVTIIGHTDTTGAAPANYELGLRRATAIRALVVSSGVKEALIEVASFGEADLLIATPDETIEPRNRRVEITVR